MLSHKACALRTSLAAELTDVDIALEVAAECTNEDAAQVDPASLPTSTEAVAALGLLR